MNDLMQKSLAEIVKEDHRAATVFEKYHLDFCCKGKRSLQQACEEGHLSAREIADALAESNLSGGGKATLEFVQLPLSQLVSYIVGTHHDYVKKEMPQIIAWLQRVVSKHGERHPEMRKVTAIFEALVEEMTAHMQKEELILFPLIIDAEGRSLAGKSNHLNITYLKAPIDMMEQEHDHAGHLLNEIRELTNSYTPPGDACTTYRLVIAALHAFEADLHQHVHLENNILFPKSLNLFNTLISHQLN